MPYSSIDGAKDAGFPTKAEGILLNLTQINKLADIYDAIKERGGAKEPFAVAWTQWKKLYKKAGDKWVKVEKKTYDLPETFDIKGVEIFASGKHKGHFYSDKDLEDMVVGFYETQSELKPYIKLGHDDKQKLAQNSGLPALGWIDNVYKKGKKFIADFVKVPKKVYELIKSGAYRRISSEIFWNIPVKGKTYKRLLKAVSFLGGDTPAVGNLDDIISLYSTTELYKSNSEVNEYEFEIKENQIKEEENEMPTIEELKAKNEVLEKENKQYQESITKTEEEKKKAEEDAKKAVEDKKKAEEGKAKADAELDKKKEEETKAEVEGKVDKLIADKHWLPADKDILVSKLIDDRKTETKKYKIGKEEKTFEERFFSIMERFDVDLNTKENSETGDIENKEDNSSLKAKAEKYMKEHKVTYKEALVQVSPEKK